MKLTVAVLCSLILCGCEVQGHFESKPVNPAHPAITPAQPQPPTDREKFNLLDAAAKQRNLRWRVFCTSHYKDEPEEFLGDAWHAGDQYANTPDWERGDHWLKSASTEADAAWQLFYAIQGEPTHPAKQPSKIAEERKPRICPPEITDRNYKVRLREPR